MKKEFFAIYVTTLFLAVYTLLSYFEVSYPLVATMFVISPMMVIWMVYAVLKSSDEPSLTFEEQFYLDASFKPLSNSAI